MPIDKVSDKQKSCNFDKSMSMTLCFFGVKIHALELFLGYKNLVILLKLGRVNWIQKKDFMQYKHFYEKATLVFTSWSMIGQQILSSHICGDV